MNRSTAPRAQPWLPFGEPPVTSPRLFCLPNAGAGAASFAPWRRLADTALVVCPVQPPGRAERFREAPHTSVDALVDDLADALADQFTGAYALYGHSVGALVVFELVRRLRQRGRPLPVHLFVSGRAAPHLPDTRKALRDLPRDELIAEVAQMGGTPPEILRERSLMESLLPLLRADFAVNETYGYRPEPPLELPLTVFGGQRDPRAEESELLAWKVHTSGPFEIQMFPGGHFFVHDHASVLIQEMARPLTL